ncbi:hypothetical protein [Paenibacillus hexagrammi]|uniref:Uncharacterized protein n=1 Tax=Paenibacillus hexagrammi TaxID=2908839 RepID=A0ABY3SHP6_9BACL|nr:hypothetical protein [Paenibacillus sp. YPD9-1]UJF33013.1 hypothetical protein L0M14_26120 [Paenibacillus sp. YPD9-1]
MITAWIGSIAFMLIAVLYVLLVLGLPYGEFAMGGKYLVLPRQMRIACGVSVIIQVIAILYVWQAGRVLQIGLPYDKLICYLFAAYLLLNTLMNAFSKSPKERWVMTPLSFITAVCFALTAIHA